MFWMPRRYVRRVSCPPEVMKRNRGLSKVKGQVENYVLCFIVLRNDCWHQNSATQMLQTLPK